MSLVGAVFLGVVWAVCGCTDAEDHGFKTSEPEVMKELERELTEAGIPFRRDQNGFLRYGSESEEVVQTLRAEVERKLSGGIAVKYEDEDSRKYLKQLLTSQGMDYRVEHREDGEWIRWYPENDAQEKEIEMKVVAHNFDIQRKKRASECEPQETPSGDSLSKGAAPVSSVAELNPPRRLNHRPRPVPESTRSKRARTARTTSRT